MQPGLSPRAHVVRDALIRAGDAAWAAWSATMPVITKPDGTPVTSADLEAEAILLAALRESFPLDAIVTEESGGQRGEGAWWVVDPIDGTSTFLEGLGHWGPTVARVEVGPQGPRVDCGALYLPRLREHYHVDTSGPHAGGYFNGAPMLRFSERTAQATVLLPSRFHTYYRLRYRRKGRCVGGTAAHLALVARGAAEAAIVGPGWASWDTAAGLALIEALGGRAALLPSGAPFSPFSDEGKAFVAGHPDDVERLLTPGTLTPIAEDP